MNTLAKVFVVINLLLGVAFLSVSCVLFAQQEFWKGEYNRVSGDLETVVTESKKRLDDQNEMIVERERSITELKNNVGSLQTDKEDVQAKLQQAENELEEYKTFRTGIETKLGNLDVSLKKAQGENISLRAQLEKGREDFDDLSKRKLLVDDENVKREEEIAELKLNNEDLSKKVSDQQKDVARLDAIIASLPPDIEIPEELKPLAPPLDALVEGVDTAGGLVVLSVGAEDEVKRGHTFYIYRDASYIGQVEVDEVLPTKSVARINTKMTRVAIQAGDGAKTRLGM